MPSLSYNEEQHQQSELRHFLVPGTYGLVSETVVAIVALFLFNISALSDRFIETGSGITISPFTLWGRVFNKLLADTQQHLIVQQLLLFALWAIAGALIYILIFRFIQFFVRAKGSVEQGVHMVEAEHAQGALHWFTSLHDFFLKVVIMLAGAAAIMTGALVCFGIASQELNNGLDGTFPGNVVLFLISFIAALLTIRLIVVGISLLSPRFRNWYNF